jgi:3-oxoacyl-[acyl-carrier protein] reductase
MTTLQNKTALVTGASRGIGRATAAALARAEAHVLVHYGRSTQEAESLVEDFDSLFATNVRGPFFLVQQLLPVLVAGSSIVAISSAVSRTVVGKPGLENPSILAYASTEGALETLVRNWAAILGPSGIRVNAVAPGVIDTDMSNFTNTEAGREVALGMQALKRLGKPEDVADVVAFVASDAARGSHHP